MAICEDCKKDMSNNNENSCTKKTIIINGKVYDRNTTYYDNGIRCHDCNILNKKGNIHHLNCDVEQCPKCDMQLLSCSCIYE